MRPRFSGIAVLALLSAIGQLGCGGGGGGGSMGPPNPVPTIQALSPNSSKQGGPAFTLSVVGSNFLPSSTVQWNGSSLQTSFVSSNLVTADIPASSLSASGPDAITVVNPAPGGGTSNSMNVTVPCVIAAPASASTQTRARLGAYYFDGWSGPLTNVQANDPGDNLNSALQITHSLPDRHGMQYAILYVDASPFDVGPADWTSAV